MRFHDRSEAGKLLAEKLSQYASRTDVIVLALAPSGVPIGYEVAKALNTPLDILVIRSLRLPSNPELAMGTVCADGALALNQEIIRWLNISETTIDKVIAAERAESQRLDKAYRGDASHLELVGKVAILVEDGITTASAMRTAVSILRLRRPARMLIAVPVASPSCVLELRGQVDDIVTCLVPKGFETVGQWYENFAEVSEGSVRNLYQRARRRFS